MEVPQQHNDIDFSVPQRQSIVAIVIMMLKVGLTLLRNVWPVLLVTLLRNDEGSSKNKWLFLIILFGALTVVFAIIRYLFYRFYIQENHLIIKTGWIKKKTLSIPLQSIQAVHLEQNLWQQVFKVTKVSFDSAGSEKVEARIDAIDVHKAEYLKQLLLSTSQVTTTEQDSPAEETVPVVTYKLSATDLLKLSISANHLEAFFILFALGINLLDDLMEAFEVDGYGWLERMSAILQEHVVLAVSVLFILVLLLSVTYSMFRTVIKYFGFTLANTNNKWKITYGLINRQQKIIPHNKIQLYSWHTNWLRRKLNFWMLDVRTVGQEQVKERQRLKIPLTSLNAAKELAVAYQITPVFEPRTANKIEPAYWVRRTLFFSLPITVLVVAVAAIWLQWQAAWFGLLLVYLTIRNYCWYQIFRWYANEEGLQLYSGLWGRKFQLLAWKKVQQVRITQTPYQRKHELANVIFTTAAGKVKLPYISMPQATQLVNTVLFIIESKEEQWM